MSSKRVDFLIFGGAGDLSIRKLLPSIASLYKRGIWEPKGVIIALGRRAIETADFRERVRVAIAGVGLEPDQIETFLSVVSYHCVAQREDYVSLRAHLDALDAARSENFPRVIYLALPPGAVEATLEALASVSLNQGEARTRLVIEKPLGTDQASAVQLNTLLQRYFSESQIYRIDHYLGKETVQNLYVLRFANTIFESIWHRDRIESVEIMVSETLGVGSRAGYYDHVGALRDMVQNHLLQLLTVVAMEVPSRMTHFGTLHEKIKVLESIIPPSKEDLLLGQYQHNPQLPDLACDYHQEPGVDPESTTETFAAVRLYIDSWRWQGVPWTLITGKFLPRKLTRIVVHFKRAPVCLFQDMGNCLVGQNALIITLQPNEGFDMLIEVKMPGSQTKLTSIPLRFQYSDLGIALPDAYETLLEDIMRGVQTQFVSDREVELSWQIVDRLLGFGVEPQPYLAGTWGPEQSVFRPSAEMVWGLQKGDID